MGSIASVFSGVSTILQAANTAKQLFGGGGQRGFDTQPNPPPVPSGKATEPDKTEFDVPGAIDAPGFLQLGSSMTPIQQRSKIATYGVSGDAGAYRDPATIEFYKNLVTRDLVDPSTRKVRAGAQVLPVERQFVTDVLGQSPRADTADSFLSALYRS